MSNYSSFFLNSSANIVQLELLEIQHPDFSKVYRIVRNAIAGVTVTLEDTTSQTFDYYPVRITPTGASSDLDQSLEIMFGDLGTILPLELDRIIRATKVTVNQGACIGVFVDGTGQIVAPPFLVGNGGYFFVPYNAVSLQVGMNDGGGYSDNSGAWTIFLNAGGGSAMTPTNRPWTVSGGLNAAYPFNSTGSTTPVARAVTAGSILKITITGTQGLGSGATQYDGLGTPSTGVAGITAPAPGQWIASEAKPGSYTKPIILYRTYRSDDLTSPLAGPLAFQVNNISFNKEGAIFACSAPRLNVTQTGELYTLDRFTMLNGFI